MLGRLGPALKATLLTSRGYELYRPTHLERTILRSVWEDWFRSDIERFAKVYGTNRRALAEVPQWARADVLAQSLWRYGVPEQWDTGRQGLGVTGLNEIESEPTYSDLIAFICAGLPELRYLELGVSVGKNLFQIARNCPSARIVGLDIERINPVLSEALGKEFTPGPALSAQTVDTLSGVQTEVQLQTFSADNITYVRGDQFRSETWAAMKPDRFNFVFSDAHHSGHALLTELDFLLDHGLIDTSGAFMMYWDDLVDIQMQDAFDRCARRLREVFGRGWHGLHWIHGTYSSRRLNGLFSTEPPPSPA